MPKLPKLLALMLAPFFMYVDGAGTGGDDKADRGDTLADGRPDPKAEADVAAEAARIAAEAAAKAEEDKEDDDEGDPDAKDDDKDDKKAKKDTRIPLKRHKEIIERERAAREAAVAELAKYKKGADVAEVNVKVEEAETKLLDLEKQYAKAVSDGEIDKAAALMKDIRTTERSIISHKGQMDVAAAEARAYERVKYDTVAERLEAAYPVLDPEHDDFDKEVVQEVLEMQDAWQLKGLSPADALQRAAKYVLGTETKKQEAAVTVDPKIKAEDVAKEREKAARKKAVEASGKQPAAADKVGMDSDKAGGSITADKVMLMSQDEFAKLDEPTLKRMRGDDL